MAMTTSEVVYTVTRIDLAPTATTLAKLTILIDEAPKPVNTSAIIPSIIVPFIIIAIILALLSWACFHINRQYQYLIARANDEAGGRSSTEYLFMIIAGWLKFRYESVKRVGRVGEENGAMPGDRWWRPTEEEMEEERRRQEDDAHYSGYRRRGNSFFPRNSRSSTTSNNPDAPPSTPLSARFSSSLNRRTSTDDASIISSRQLWNSLLPRFWSCDLLRESVKAVTRSRSSLRSKLSVVKHSITHFHKDIDEDASNKLPVHSLTVNFFCVQCCATMSAPSSAFFSFRTSVRKIDSFFFSSSNNEDTKSTEKPTAPLEAITIIPFNMRTTLLAKNDDQDDDFLGMSNFKLKPAPPPRSKKKDQWKRQGWAGNFTPPLTDYYNPSIFSDGISPFGNSDTSPDGQDDTSLITDPESIITIEDAEYIVIHKTCYFRAFGRDDASVNTERESIMCIEYDRDLNDHNSLHNVIKYIRLLQHDFVNPANRSSVSASSIEYDTASMNAEHGSSMGVNDASCLSPNTFLSIPYVSASIIAENGSIMAVGIASDRFSPTVSYDSDRSNITTHTSALQTPLPGSPGLRKTISFAEDTKSGTTSPVDVPLDPERVRSQDSKSEHKKIDNKVQYDEKRRRRGDMIFNMLISFSEPFDREKTMSGYSIYEDAQSTFSRASTLSVVSVYTDALEEQV